MVSPKDLTGTIKNISKFSLMTKYFSSIHYVNHARHDSSAWLERPAFNRVVGGSNPPQDTYASGECVGVTLSNYSPVAT